MLKEMNANPDYLPLADAILNTITYSDIFDYPLTSAQVQRYLSGVCAPVGEICNQLEHLADAGMISHAGPYYFLNGRQNIVLRRAYREQLAQMMWPKAISYGRVIARLPFVRMVAVTGSLAVNNIDSDGDIDYLIVTAPDQMWLCRLIVLAVVRLAAWQGLSLCPNYLISERALALPERNLYAAHEFVQMVPLYGLEVFQRMRVLNAWVKDFLPNAGDSTGGFAETQPERLARLRYLVERFLLTAPGQWLSHWEMTRKIRKLSQENDGNPEAVFNADTCKGHSKRHGQRTLGALSLRLNQPILQAQK